MKPVLRPDGVRGLNAFYKLLTVLFHMKFQVYGQQVLETILLEYVFMHFLILFYMLVRVVVIL